VKVMFRSEISHSRRGSLHLGTWWRGYISGIWQW